MFPRSSTDPRRIIWLGGASPDFLAEACDLNELLCDLNELLFKDARPSVPAVVVVGRRLREQELGSLFPSLMPPKAQHKAYHKQHSPMNGVANSDNVKAKAHAW